MLRYLRRLADRDLALDRTMIPLGSCTMKLNATTEMMPVTWPEFARIHPFAPLDQADGLPRAVRRARGAGCARSPATTRCRCSPTPVRRASSPGCSRSASTTRAAATADRDVCLIPASAHGTNAASAAMAGHAGRRRRSATTTATSTSTTSRRRRTSTPTALARADGHVPVDARRVRGPRSATSATLVHEHGGQVYLDGANLNALVGVAKPGRFGADVSHLNLHKTFCIPHGGGGPGRRPGRGARAPRAVPARPPARSPTPVRRPAWARSRRRRGARPASCRSRGRTSR